MVKYEHPRDPGLKPEIPLEDIDFRKIPDTDFTYDEIRKIMRRGFEHGDQIFTSDRGGSYNASLFGRLIDLMPEHFRPITAPISDTLFEYIVGNIQIDVKHAAKMSDEDLIRPVYIITLNDPDPYLLIDGHHRIVRLYAEGYRQCYAVVGDRQIAQRCYVAKPRNRGI